MNRLMATEMQKSKDIVDVPYPQWRLALNSANIDDFVQALNTTFIQIDYLGYPLHNESEVRAAVQIYLLGGKQLVEIERHNSKGRSDMEFLAKDVYWILEFKYARKGDNSESLLAEALQQMQKKQYGRIPDNAKQIVRAALIFDSEKKQFVKYQAYPSNISKV